MHSAIPFPALAPALIPEATRWATDFMAAHWLGVLFMLLSTVCGLFAAGHVIVWKRDPRAALSWLALILAVPLVGAIVYWVFGINRLSRRAEALYADHEAEEPDPAATVLQPHDVAQAELAAFVGRRIAAPLLGGNRVEPMEVDAALDAMVRAVERAERSVTLCTYIFDSDDLGLRMRDALTEAHRRGVEVRVLIDSVGDHYTRPLMAPMLRDRGVPVATFLPSLWPWRMAYANLRNHRKLLVIDGFDAFTGGANIRLGLAPGLETVAARGLAAVGDAGDGRDGGETGRNLLADLHFHVQGPVVRSLQHVFCEDWCFTTRERLRGDAFFPTLDDRGPVVARVIQDGPAEREDHVRWTLLGALACARRRVRIATPYFLPDQGLITALVTAAGRGVDVEILIPEKGNLLLPQWASTALLWQVLQGGCRVVLVPPPFDHSKVLRVDDTWSLIGSANWDARSLRLNFELNLECHDTTLAANLDAVLDHKVRRGRETSLAEVDARPLPIRLRDGLARLATPYL